MHIPPELTSINPMVYLFLYIWSILWKGLGLWYASKYNQKIWFIAMIVINTAGLLEIAYLFYFAKHRLTLTQLSKEIKIFIKQLKAN